MRKYLVNVSPWVLASACALLAIIIGSFAVNNYTREKKLMEAALMQKGESVLRFIDSGIKVSFRGFMMGRDNSRYSWADHVQAVIDQVMDDEEIHFVELLDEGGIVRAASGSDRIGTQVGQDLLTFIRTGGAEKPGSRIHYDSDGEAIGFQVALMYEPRMFRNMGPRGMGGGRMFEPNFRGHFDDSNLRKQLEQFRGKTFTLLVELDLEKYNSAVSRQVIQIVILSVVLLLVGVGGWLSLLTLQGLKGSQVRLQQIRDFNDVLIESLPVGLIATDSSGDIQMVNEAAGMILGIEEAKVLQKKPATVLPDEIAQLFGNKVKNKDVDTFEKSIHTIDGSLHTLLMTSVDVASKGDEKVGGLLLLQDVTELRGLETQLRRSERLAALGKMAAGVAHELRNPLSSIKGLAVVLKSKLGEDPEGNNTADVLVREVERLNRSIGELLDYARPEKLDLGQVRLSEIIRKTMELVRLDAEQQGVELKMFTADIDDTVLVDSDKMKQVFLNIFLNSLQADQQQGSIDIHIDKQETEIVCEVTDHGVGIAEENLAKVFDPYFTTKSEGTGLGLAISAKIIEEHGGRVSIQSAPGEGATVKIRLPESQSPA